MKFRKVEDNGFGSGWRLSIGWLQVDYTRFEDHWYLQIMWAKPMVVR